MLGIISRNYKNKTERFSLYIFSLLLSYKRLLMVLSRVFVSQLLRESFGWTSGYLCNSGNLTSGFLMGLSHISAITRDEMLHSVSGPPFTFAFLLLFPAFPSP